MRIVIVGAGHTGTQLAQRLVREKHEVSLIESNEERARHASNRIDCLVLHDEGNSLAALEEAGISKADALVCVTDSDEVNMIICGLAASRYPGIKKIARVSNDDYIRINQHVTPNHSGRSAEDQEESHEEIFFQDPRILGIDHFIHPDIEAARAVLHSLSHGALGNILHFSGTPYELGSINIAEGSAFDGLCIKDYHSLVKEESLITLLERESGKSRECLLPSGSTVLKKGDRIHIIADEGAIEHIFSLAGREEKPLRRIGIVGGGQIGALIADGILKPQTETLNFGGERKKKRLASILRSFMPKKTRRVVIIEQSYELCKELAATLPEALILNQDISDESFISEEHLDDLDLIITATPNQELNMITAIYLKSRGVMRTIALVSGGGYETISRKLGIDVVIPMQSVVVDSIISNLTSRGIKGVYNLGDGTVEILEAEIDEESPAAEKAITDFMLSEGGLIILVDRGEESFIPKGDYIFKPGDKIIFITKSGKEAELEKFFGTEK